MKILSLSKNSATIVINGYDKGFLNSIRGREELIEECTQEVATEIFAVWGDTPTRIDPVPEVIPEYEPLPPTAEQLRLNDLEETLATLMYGGGTV